MLLKYQSKKIVEAEPMSKSDANKLGLVRDWDDVDEPGYLVVYPDGYRSWSPSKPFNDGYDIIL